MSVFVTQQAVEVLYLPNPAARVTRQAVEAIYEVAPGLRVSREALEVAYSWDPALRVTRQLAEVLYIGVPSSAITPVPSRGTHHWIDHGGSHWSDAAVRWVFDGQELILNASEVKVEDSPRWSAPELLSGDLVLSMDREYDETMADGTPRPGMIRESGRKIELNFPRMPTHFYFFLRRFRTFGQSFVIKIFLFDGLDKERCKSDDGRFWYASNGAWEPGSVVVYKNGEVVTDGISINHTHGIVRFMNPISTEDVVQVQYIWAPRVSIVGQLDPDFKTGQRDPECRVKFTVREVRPSSTPDSWTRPTTGSGPGTGGGQPSTRTPTLGLLATVYGDTLRSLFLMALVRAAGTLPSDISDLWHWLDATQGVTESGSLHKISQVNDRSGRAKHATQSTDDLQPVLDANAQNGLPMIRFNVLGNTGRALSVSNTVDNMVDTDDFTAFAVMKKLDPTFAPIYSWYSLTPGLTPIGNVWGMGVNEIAFYNTLNGYALRTSHSIATGQCFIAAIQRSGNTWKLWINGVLIQTRTDSRNLYQESSPAPHFGWWESGGQFAWFHGMLGEWVVYKKATSDLEFAQVMTYLRDKWNVAQNFGLREKFLGLLAMALGAPTGLLHLLATVSRTELATLGMLALASVESTATLGLLGQAYNPLSLTVHFWLDPTELALSNNDPISSWTDKGPNAYHHTQSGTNRPVLSTNVKNGLPAVKYDNSNDYFIVPSAAYINPRNTSFTWVGVYYNNATASDGSNVAGSDEITEGCTLYIDDTTGAPAMFFRNASGIFAYANSNFPTRNVWVVVTWQWDHVNKTLNLRINGTLDATNTNAGMAIATLPDVLNRFLGVQHRAGGVHPSALWYSQYMGDQICVKSVLSGTDLTNLENYMKNKWGIT